MGFWLKTVECTAASGLLTPRGWEEWVGDHSSRTGDAKVRGEGQGINSPSKAEA